MATYEVETIHYNNFGGIQTKECDLFDSKTKAVKYAISKINNRGNLFKQGDIKDGLVKLIDDKGFLKQVIKFGEL